MKFLLFQLFLALFYTLSFSQDKVWLDLEGNKIDKDIFLKVWRSPDYDISRWDYIGSDGKRYAKLTQYEYEVGTYDYSIIRSELEKLTNKKVPDSSTIFINYEFKDDLCSLESSNKWSREKINARKRWFQRFKKKLNENDIFYLWLFEEGIQLSTKKNKKKEYFFMDKDNFFRTKIFANQTLCGSGCIIKPNGQILVRKGEGVIFHLLEVIEPEKWSKFFKKSN